MGIVIKILWATIPSIIVGIVLAWWNHKQKKRDARYDEHEQDAIKQETLRLSLLVAVAQLSYAVAMAYKRGEPNGEMEVGIEQYNKAMGKFREFEREQMVKNINN